MRRRTLPISFVLWLVAAVAHAGPSVATNGAGMVASVNAEASAAGAEILSEGGNAVDAAVATALALAVAHPMAGNLGGGGFLLYRAPDGRLFALDFRETAPRRLRGADFLDEDGRPDPERRLRGGLSIGVPGSVAGLAAAHARWGRLPWSRLVEPAATLAERGPTVTPYMASLYERFRERLERHDAARVIYLPAGPPEAGSRLPQRDLASTLRLIARDGERGFYRGRVARAIADEVRSRGGRLDRRDLKRYRPVWREPLQGTYRGHRISSFPPPSSGGVALLQILAMLEPHDVAASGFGTPGTVHLTVEAERRAYADRSKWLGDPSFADVPVEALLDPDYLARRATSIRPARATPSNEVLPGRPPGVDPGDTLHLTTADGEGGLLTLTTTLNTAFGTGIVARGTGVLLNNEMDDFALAPGIPNAWGLVGGDANAVAGRKRPLSSMTPTIVESPDPDGVLFALGSPGGGTIITTVMQVIVNVVDHGMPFDRAIDAPRFHHQWLPDEIRHEPDAFEPATATELERRGHRLAESGSIGNVNGVMRRDDGRWLGVADDRRGGRAAGPTP